MKQVEEQEAKNKKAIAMVAHNDSLRKHLIPQLSNVKFIDIGHKDSKMYYIYVENFKQESGRSLNNVLTDMQNEAKGKPRDEFVGVFFFSDKRMLKFKNNEFVDGEGSFGEYDKSCVAA